MPKIGEGATNTVVYWDDTYSRGHYPTSQSDNVARYRRAVDFQVGTSALDIGCGQCGIGAILLERPDCTYVGVDYSRAALETHFLCREWEKRYALYRADWRDIESLNLGTFDTVYLNEILEHEPEPVALLAVAARTARQRIVLTVPAYNALSWSEHRGEHAWDFTEEELRALLEPLGEVSTCERVGRCVVVYVDPPIGRVT